jgi:hypothetical protein
MIGDVAEYQTADDAADEEGRLRRGAEVGLVANPLELARTEIARSLRVSQLSGRILE